MESPDVRDLIGLNLKSGRLYTKLPGGELIKPLRKMVVDIARKDGESRRLNKTEQMIDYVQSFGKADKPDLTKKTAERPIDGLQKAEFTRATKRSRRRAPDPAKRTSVVPKNCPLNVTDNRIAEIYGELKTLKLGEWRNAIAVLMRVFLEMSVDHFLEQNHIPLSTPNPTGGGVHHKKFDRKLRETVDILVKVGVPRTHFAAVLRSLSVSTSPLNVELLHLYVHERFATPSPQELTGAWNNAQGLLEKIWP